MTRASFLHKRARKSVFPACSRGAMLAAMTDAEALGALRNAIRMLFPTGPARKRWLACANRIQDEESHGTGWTRRSRRRQNSRYAARSIRCRN